MPTYRPGSSPMDDPLIIAYRTSQSILITHALHIYHFLTYFPHLFRQGRAHLHALLLHLPLNAR